jgi:hypothetical protein
LHGPRLPAVCDSTSAIGILRKQNAGIGWFFVVSGGDTTLFPREKCDMEANCRKIITVYDSLCVAAVLRFDVV